MKEVTFAKKSDQKGAPVAKPLDEQLEYTRKLLEPDNYQKLANIKVDLGNRKIDATYVIQQL